MTNTQVDWDVHLQLKIFNIKSLISNTARWKRSAHNVLLELRTFTLRPPLCIKNQERTVRDRIKRCLATNLSTSDFCLMVLLSYVYVWSPSKAPTLWSELWSVDHIGRFTSCSETTCSVIVCCLSSLLLSTLELAVALSAPAWSCPADNQPRQAWSIISDLSFRSAGLSEKLQPTPNMVKSESTLRSESLFLFLCMDFANAW